MKLELDGKEELAASQQELWASLIDPDVLTKCIPGCKSMTETAPGIYKAEMQLKVGAVGGSFEGDISLLDMNEPNSCRIEVTGSGSLGTGSGNAVFTITPIDDGQCLLSYEGKGDVGGLVAGVGQRILGSVSKHLIKQFFKGLRKHFAEANQPVEAQ